MNDYKTKPTKRTMNFLNSLEILVDKIKAMGVKRKSVLMAANDLVEIYYYIKDIKNNIDLLLKTDSSNWDQLQDIFVELDVLLFHVKDHIGHSRKPLQYLSEYCEKHISKC